MKLSEMIDRYLSFNYQLSDRSKFLYREHLTRLVTALGDPPLEEIDHWRLAGFMGSLKRKKDGKPLAPGYQSQIYRAVFTFFNFCAEEGLIPANPMKRVKPPVLITGPKPRLSLAQAQQLLDEIEKTDFAARNKAMVLLMLDSGLRKSEVVYLTIGDIDLSDKRLRVYSPKKHKYREVPLSEMTALALETYLKKRPKPKTPAEPVFLAGRGPIKGQPITPKVIEELMRRLRNKLGFKLHAHLLRHTFGNHWIREGGLRQLQKVMGHTSITTTAQFYTDPDFADLQRQHRTAAPTAQLDK